MNVLFYLMTFLAVQANYVNTSAPSAVVTETSIWDGEAGDNQWYTPQNWSGDTLPGLNNDIVIPLEDTVLLESGNNTIIESILLENGAYLYIGVNDTLQTTGGGTGSDAFRLEGTPDSTTTAKVAGVLTILNATSDGIDLNEYCYFHNTNAGRIAIINPSGDGIEAGSSFKNDGAIIINGAGGKGIQGSGTIPDAGSIITNIGLLSISNSTDNGIRLIGDLDMVNEGTLVMFGNIDDAFTSTAGKFTNNGTLHASGRIKTEHFIHGVGGIVSVYDTNEPLEFSQGLNFSTNTLIYDINGASIGDYDQVYVTSGGIDMDTTTLVLQGAYVPQPGDIFTIIDNEIGAPLGNSEFFVGLPEGSIVNFNGVDLYVTYNAGDENDVALVTDVSVLVDADDDGSPALYDCDDNNPNISPGEPEIPNNDIDENCDGIALIIDVDEDGFNSDDDCNDLDANINPDATEICDGVDNNCDGQTDEGFAQVTYYLDLDGDGYGNADSSITTCGMQPANFVTDSTDCADTNFDINPGALELCDGIDNNCNGETDEGTTMFIYFEDGDDDGFGNTAISIIICETTAPIGYSDTGGDCDDTNNTVYPGAPELCDDQDNNCNLETDEGLTFTTYYIDEDEDGYGNADMTITSCLTTPDPGYSANAEDCDDTNPDINPGAMELCDGIDNNCDGNADEGLMINTYYADADEDGFGDFNTTFDTCMMTAPMGYVANSSDCDDTNPEINPDVMEIPGNMIDEDCDGDAAPYPDNDNDSFTSDVDCDDNNPDINPDAVEICDGLDNNCDGSIDEGLATITVYVDMDNDGFGDASSVFDTCWTTIPIGYASNGDDCNDVDPDINPDATEIPNNGIDDDCNGGDFVDVDEDGFEASEDCDDDNDTVYPGAPELCDGIDNSCNGEIDEGLTLTFYYADSDEDGFGDPNAEIETCDTSAPAGYATNSEDCDDTNADINPFATEIPDNDVDEDCDGEIAVGLEVVDELLVTVSPNPTTGLVRVQSDQFNDAKLELMDLLGQVVLSEAFVRNSTLEIHELPAGVYWLSIKDNRRIYQMQLVKE